MLQGTVIRVCDVPCVSCYRIMFTYKLKQNKSTNDIKKKHQL